jgi:hypothetical protein
MHIEFNPGLIQRIESPMALLPPQARTLVAYYAKPYAKDNREAFAATLKALKDLIPLDYMGSAEFEWGEVPKLLRAVSQQRTHFSPFKAQLTVRSSAVPKPSKKVTLVGWCRPQHRQELARFLSDQAAGKDSEYHIQERTCLQENCLDEFPAITGWLSLDNGWFVSQNAEQARQLAYLLGIAAQN